MGRDMASSGLSIKLIGASALGGFRIWNLVKRNYSSEFRTGWSILTHFLDAGVALQRGDGFIKVADHCRVFHADQVQGRDIVEGGSPRFAMCIHDEVSTLIL